MVKIPSGFLTVPRAVRSTSKEGQVIRRWASRGKGLLAGGLVAFVGAVASVVPAGATMPGSVGRIVFTGRDLNGNPAICTVMPQGGTVAYVRGETQGGTPSYDWSPGGRAIAFTSSIELELSSGRVAIDEVATVAPDGSAFSLLTGVSEAANYQPGWSPDGTQIVYAQAFRDQGATPGRLKVMSADGSAKRDLWIGPPLSPPSSPRWSPDGARIAFQGRREDAPTLTYGVYVISADGGQPVYVADNAYDPDWQPNGTRIAYADNFGISTVKPDGSDARHVPGTAVGDLNPSWSPDGTMLAYARAGIISADPLLTGLSIHVVWADGSGDRVLVPISQTYGSLLGFDLAWGSAGAGAAGTSRCAGAADTTPTGTEEPPPAADTTPPKRPTGLKAKAGSHVVTLRWHRVAAGDRKGYRVYRIGRSRRVRVGTAGNSAKPHFTIHRLKNGRRYRFDITAVDTSDNESKHSIAVIATPNRPCIVPKLAGRTLPAARKALTNARCRLGTVKTPNGMRSTRGLVVAGSRPRPHARRASGTKIAVVLRRR